MSEEENLEEELGIRPGAVVDSQKHKYVIIKLLGEGGFGAVFKVHDIKDKSLEYAMKVEKKLENRRHSKLKMEIAILKLVANERTATTNHFTKIIDRGKKEKYFFLVMQIVGKSLADLKMQRPEKVFSVGTGLGAAMQCLEAVEDLHKHGFIHRDLKPANFACGLGSLKRCVYILDFGIARRILNDKDELKTPRASVCFKGTVRFASMSCHKNSELGPKDDCESWFYLLLDLIISTGLPWKKIQDRNEVLRVKEDSRKDKRDQLLHGMKCKETLGKIMDYIDQQQYYDRVDYSFIYEFLKEAATVAGVNLEDMYDWEDDNTKSRKK